MPGTASLPLASVIIPNWNGAHLLPACLTSLRAQTWPSLEVLLVDGGSRDGSSELVAERFPEVRVLRLPRNQGFAGNVNVGLRAARGDVLLLLNNDAEAEPEWVAMCLGALESNPAAGSVASLMLFADGIRINSAGDELSARGFAHQRGAGARWAKPWDERTVVFGASGGAAAYRRDMLADVGLLDEAYFAYLEDVDLAFRAQLRGWECQYEPRARVRHRGSATGGGALASYYNGRNLIRLWAKNLPRTLIPSLLPKIASYQLERGLAAARAWRGEAARATLRGQITGILQMGSHLAARRLVQRRRRVSDEYVLSLFREPVEGPG